MMTDQGVDDLKFDVADPRSSEVRALVAELDSYLLALYPAESNHLIDVDDLVGPDRRFVIARTGGGIVGCGAVIFHGREYAEIKRIYVAPRARGSQIGSVIISHLEAEATAAGIPLIRLETGIRQPEALAAFTRLGFQRCDVFGDYPPDDPNSVFMEKHLNSQGPT